jgi:hypothetical protein
VLWTRSVAFALGSGARELIDLRGEDEVVTGEARGGLRPGREGGPSPLELQARMVAFGLGKQRDSCDESECATEVVECELAGQVAGPIALPARDRAT